MNPVDVLTKDAVILAHILNALSRAIGQGFGGYWQAFQAVLAIGGLDLNALKQAYKDIANDTDRQAVEEAFKKALSLENASLQDKLVKSVDVIEEGVAVLEQGVYFYGQLQKVISDAQVIFK